MSIIFNGRILNRPGLLEWGLVLALFAVTPLLFVSTPDWLGGYTGRAINNLGHIPLFAVVSLFLYRLLAFRPLTKWLLITAMVAVTGTGVEYLQTWVGRNASWDDVLRNLLGAWLALSWLSARSGPIIAARVVTSIAALSQLVFTVAVGATEYQVLRQLPVIANFETPFEEKRWHRDRAVRSQEHVTEGKYSLKIHFNTNRWSPAELGLLPRDWRGYDHLKFDIFNPDTEDLRILLRIDDLNRNWYETDRYNTWLDLKPGWNYLEISLDEVRLAPKDRELDMSQIRQIILSSNRLPQAKEIYTDNWRLE